MIEFAKITGVMKKNTLQVRMRTGECLFAPMTIIGNTSSLPSEQWISSNKDNFLAIVDFEGGNLISPVIVGFYPVKGAKSETYNPTERLLEVTTKLLEQLMKAKINTNIGPQPFMADTQAVFKQIQSELKEIKKLILPLDL